MIKSKVYFSKSGSGSISGRITVPKAYLDLMKINEIEKEINIDIIDGRLVIEKVATNELKGISYDDMVKFILNNVEHTYNVSKCLDDFVGGLGEFGTQEGEFFMTEEQEHFRICSHFEILNEDTDNEEIKYTFDVEKL